MTRLKHLVLGLGSIGARHVQTLGRAGERVVGFDPFVKDFAGCPTANSIDEAWASGPDMVWICTPTHLHARQAAEAIDRGCHVFIEKPVAHELAAARRLLARWRRRRKRLVWVGCNMRYHPGPRRLKEAIDRGRIGRPLVFRTHFSHYLPNMRPGVDYHLTYAAHADQGGGVILDDIHDIDLALWLGGPARKVVALAARSGRLETDAEDVAHITLLHENRAVSEIHMDYLRQDKSRGIEAIGESGALEWRSRGKMPERGTLRWFGPRRQVETIWKGRIEGFREMFDRQLADVLKARRCPERYGEGLERAVEALAIAAQARKSYDCAG
jgi:predicted dehydrogenase